MSHERTFLDYFAPKLYILVKGTEGGRVESELSLPLHKDTEDSEDKNTADFESNNIDNVGLTNAPFLNMWREEGFIHSLITNLLKKM